MGYPRKKVAQRTGDPFGVLIADYEFGRDLGDIDILEKVAAIAASSNTPFISPPLLPQCSNFGSFTELAGPRDLGKIFNESEHI